MASSDRGGNSKVLLYISDNIKPLQMATHVTFD